MKPNPLPFLLAATLSAAVSRGAPPQPAAPAAAPEDVLYEANVLVNPGFEKGGFERDRTKGWHATLQNGMEARFESASPTKPVQPFEGRKALRLLVKDPVKYSTKELNGDWGVFEKAGNGGKGPPKAELQQLVRVKPGAKYALRFRWRASGLYSSLAPGPDRGVVSVAVRCEWSDADGRYLKGQQQAMPREIATLLSDSDEWTTWAFPDFSPDAKLPYAKHKNVPFVAPGGAVYAKIFFRFTCQRAKARPEFWLDGVEFAELPANLPALPAAKPAAKPDAKPDAKPAAPAPAPAAPAAKPTAPAAPAAPAPETVAKDGGVLKLKDCGGAEFLPAIHLAGWKGSAKLAKPGPAAAPGVSEYEAGAVRIRAEASFEPAADGSLRASWTFTPQEDADLAMLGVCARLPADGFAGCSLRLDGADVALPAEPGEKPHLFSGRASAVSFRDASGRERFSVAFDEPARVSLQDNRHWKGTAFEFRVRPSGDSPYRAGDAQRLSLSLRGGAPDAR